MTREDAKEILTHNWTRVDNPNYSESELDEAFFMAIEALSAEQVTSKLKNPCDSLLKTDSADAKEHKSKLDGDLISRADAVNAVHKYFVDLFDDEPYETDEDGDEVFTDMKSVNALLKHNKAISKAIKALPSAEAVHKPDYSYEADMVKRLRQAEDVQGWIPFTRRPMTEEEQKDYPNCTFMFDCVLPDDGDEILVSNRRFVWMDTFCNDIDGCYLDGGDDIDEDMAWMPLPTPYKGGEDE